MTRLTASALVVAVLLGLSACSGEVSSNTPDQGLEATPGDGTDDDAASEAPDFSFETFEGEIFSLAEQRGTPVVLNFWESW